MFGNNNRKTKKRNLQLDGKEMKNKSNDLL